MPSDRATKSCVVMGEIGNIFVEIFLEISHYY